jgi:hypothetical protein
MFFSFWVLVVVGMVIGDIIEMLERKDVFWPWSGR